jgi:hypothetical protein
MCPNISGTIYWPLSYVAPLIYKSRCNEYSDLRPGTGSACLFSSVPPGKCNSSSLDLATTRFLHVVFSSSSDSTRGVEKASLSRHRLTWNIKLMPNAKISIWTEEEWNRWRTENITGRGTSPIIVTMDWTCNSNEYMQNFGGQTTRKVAIWMIQEKKGELDRWWQWNWLRIVSKGRLWYQQCWAAGQGA